jgi:hypothetical protein
MEDFRGAVTDPQHKKELINKSIETAAYALGMAYKVCGLQNHISGTVVIDNQLFELKFTKLDEQRPKNGTNESEV